MECALKAIRVNFILNQCEEIKCRYQSELSRLVSAILTYWVFHPEISAIFFPLQVKVTTSPYLTAYSWFASCDPVLVLFGD